MFQHYLITRFNYGWLENAATSRSGTAVNTNQWLDERVQLFETYCLPSVQSQTCSRFKWIIQFDPQTPASILDRCGNGSNIHIIQEPISDYFQQLTIDTPYLITSRLDNDDALHKDYIHSVQARFDNRTQLIDTRGIQFDRQRNRVHTDGRRKPNSPFLTLIEKLNGSPKTVHYADHAKMRRHFPAIRLRQRLWCQVVHETNLMNRIRGRRIWWPDLSGFPDALQSSKSISSNTTVEQQLQSADRVA